MCFVLDVNSFHRFFDPNCKDYADFEPLHGWLYDNSGPKMVFGGTKFRKEMSQLKKYHGYLIELKKMRKLIEIDKDKVDCEELRLIDLVSEPDFDDAHIVAILSISGCLLFASHDKRSFKYVKNRALYPKNSSKRFVYSRRRHLSLLTREKIVSLQHITA